MEIKIDLNFKEFGIENPTPVLILSFEKRKFGLFIIGFDYDEDYKDIFKRVDGLGMDDISYIDSVEYFMDDEKGGWLVGNGRIDDWDYYFECLNDLENWVREKNGNMNLERKDLYVDGDMDWGRKGEYFKNNF
jgi:hypothetical protein